MGNGIQKTRSTSLIWRRLRQAGALDYVLIRPLHKTNFHWSNSLAPERALCVAFDPPPPPGGAQGSGWGWSGGIDITALGETHVRLRSQLPGEPHRIMRVEVGKKRQCNDLGFGLQTRKHFTLVMMVM